MPDYPQLFESLRQSPEPLGPPTRYHVVAAFMLGYDLGNEGGVLEGFREWLVVRANGCNNRLWTAIVPYLALPDEEDPEAAVKASDDAATLAVNKLLDCFSSFYREKQKHGLRKILLDYEH